MMQVGAAAECSASFEMFVMTKGCAKRQPVKQGDFDGY
jgi:hypothetical protein